MTLTKLQSLSISLRQLTVGKRNTWRTNTSVLQRALWQPKCCWTSYWTLLASLGIYHLSMPFMSSSAELKVSTTGSPILMPSILITLTTDAKTVLSTKGSTQLNSLSSFHLWLKSASFRANTPLHKLELQDTVWEEPWQILQLWTWLGLAMMLAWSISASLALETRLTQTCSTASWKRHTESCITKTLYLMCQSRKCSTITLSKRSTRTRTEMWRRVHYQILRTKLVLANSGFARSHPIWLTWVCAWVAAAGSVARLFRQHS